jgi:tetraacyldisaccharide 4'-kinase
VTNRATVSERSGFEREALEVLNVSALDRLYAGVARARRRWHERHPEARRRLLQPVISVGNLSVGGTGKTPLAVAIAEWFIVRGERPAILSRGYKRADAVDGVVVVSDGARVLADLSCAGDEPLMIARVVPRAIVCVAEDRHLAGVVAERRLGATVHILDDGFQHVQLARDLDILVTSVGEITQGRVLPFGRLRESRDAAARADFVVVIDADSDAARLEAWELGISGFATARRTLAHTGGTGGTGGTGPAGAGDTGDTGALGAAGAPAAPMPPMSPASPVVAVAGIGHPQQFFSMLRDAGYQLVATMSFADHHRYTAPDVARIAAEAERAGAAVVFTTEKDLVRFESLGPLPFRLIPMPMRLDVNGWDALTASLDHAVHRARGAA